MHTTPTHDMCDPDTRRTSARQIRSRGVSSLSISRCIPDLSFSLGPVLSAAILGILLFALRANAYAQALDWRWARGGVGGSGHDMPIGYNSSGAYGSVQSDSLGNAYEIIYSESSTITIGTSTFSNPGGVASAYLVRYDSAGTVSWARRTGGYIPICMFTTGAGYSYLMFDVYSDSVNIGGVIVRDPTLSTTHHAMCLARYSPSGNVESLHTHELPDGGGWTSMRQFGPDKIFAIGVCNRPEGDTVGGVIIRKGHFISLLDTTGAIIRLRSVGTDSSGGFFLAPSRIAAGGTSVYVALTYLFRPLVYQDVLPIANIRSYVGQHLLVKFDSLLNFKWYRACSKGVIASNLLHADEHDNVYLDVAGQSSLPPDTLRFDTTRVPLPFIPPINQFSFPGIMKVNSEGVMQWLDTFRNVNSSDMRGICTDRTGNVYLMGTYSTFILVGRDTLKGAGNLYVIKLSPTGRVLWGQNSQNANGYIQLGGIAEDGRGNIFVNGYFSASSRPRFGADSVVCHPPVAGSPFASDVFIARLGSCRRSDVAVTASGPLAWCGVDSVILTSDQAYRYRWSTGDTSASVVVRASGPVSVYASDSLGCYARSAAYVVQAHDLPQVDAQVRENVKCYGGTDGAIGLLTSGGAPPYSYSYLPAVADTSHVPAGQYHITVTDSVGCTAADSIVVTQPAAALSVSIDSLYQGPAPLAAVVATADGGTRPYLYTWDSRPVQNTDTARLLTTGWYTVSVTDSNGCRVTDSIYIRTVTGITAIAVGQLSVYPNPAQDVLYIDAGGESGTILLYDMGGRLVLRQNTDGSITPVSLARLANGPYTIELISKDKKYYDKVIVSH